MECKFCGANIEDGLTVCPECQKDLTDEVAEISAAESVITEEETVAEEVIEEINDDVAEEVAEYEETAEYELTDEYDSDIADLEAIDGADNENIDFYDEYELAKASRTPVIFKIIAIIAAVAIVVCGGFFAYSYFTAPDTLPLIYTTQENDIYNSYAFKNNMKEPVLLSTATKALFSQNSDFVVNSDRIFYINNDSSLFMLGFNSKKAVKIADSVEKSSLVMSSDGKKLLYSTAAGDGFDLYLYNGKTSEKISTIKTVAVSTISVNYGFSNTSNDSIWYADIQKNAPSSEAELSEEEKAALSNGTLYVKIGNNNATEYQTNVSGVKYFDIEGKTLVYTTKKVLDPETYSDSTLYIKEADSDPVVLVNNFYSQPVVAVNTPQKGIVYLSDSVKGTDEEGNYNFTSTYNLMFKPFGSEAYEIDNGISYFYNASRLTKQLYDPFDYSSANDAGNTLLYIKNNKIYITSDLKAPAEEAAIDFAASAPPVFSKNMDKVVYTSAENTLYYRPITNGSIGNAVQVAEKVATYRISDDGSKIVYASTPDDANPTAASINIYNTKNGKSTEIAADAYPLIYFSVDQKAVYYINNFDTAAQTVTLNEYKNGKHTVIKDQVSNFVTSETGVPYILSLPATEGADASSATATIYTFKNPGNIITIDENIVGLSAY